MMMRGFGHEALRGLSGLDQITSGYNPCGQGYSFVNFQCRHDTNCDFSGGSGFGICPPNYAPPAIGTFDSPATEEQYQSLQAQELAAAQAITAAQAQAQAPAPAPAPASAPASSQALVPASSSSPSVSSGNTQAQTQTQAQTTTGGSMGLMLLVAGLIALWLIMGHGLGGGEE